MATWRSYSAAASRSAGLAWSSGTTIITAGLPGSGYQRHGLTFACALARALRCAQASAVAPEIDGSESLELTGPCGVREVYAHDRASSAGRCPQAQRWRLQSLLRTQL